MRYTFKRSLFGYKREQVEACIDALDKQIKQQQEEFEQRIKQVVEENVQLSVELKVARSGYKDSAELMMSAQSRVRDLERYLETERLRVTKLEQQQIKLKQTKPETDLTLVQSLQERITALEETAKAIRVETDKHDDGTLYEQTEYAFPEGIDAADKDTDNARGVMQRLFRLRSQEQEQK